MGELYSCVLGAITLIIFFPWKRNPRQRFIGWLKNRVLYCCSGASGNMEVCSCWCSQDQIWFTHSQIRDLNTQARAGRGSGKNWSSFKYFFTMWLLSHFEQGVAMLGLRGALLLKVSGHLLCLGEASSFSHWAWWNTSEKICSNQFSHHVLYWNWDPQSAYMRKSKTMQVIKWWKHKTQNSQHSMQG